MNNGWQASAEAWMASLGEDGDFGRQYVLDPTMLPRALAQSPKKALDVGCGEGRFCRMLRQHGVEVTGIDPTSKLIASARARDAGGIYIEAPAERLPLPDESVDLVVSYLTLIDIPDIQAGIREMERVLKPGGALLIANLNGFNTACVDSGWVRSGSGEHLHYPVDNYLQERMVWVEYRGIRIQNHHRPLSAYMRTLLAAGLRLRYFDEPAPIPGAPEPKARVYRRVPWFVVMEWLKPA